jgi:hypothetical protein
MTATPPLSPQALSALIGAIYDCALDPAGWEQALAGIREMLRTETAVLYLLDARNDRMLINRTAGMDPHMLEDQAKHIPEINARLAQDLASWPSFDEPHEAAEGMLRDGGPVQGLGGVLQARDPAAAAELRAAIKQATQGEADIGKAGLAIRLTEIGVPPVTAHVLPLTGGDLRTRLQPSAVAAVFISAPPGEQEGAAATAAAFDLTPAETRVLASLLAGRTLAETAEASASRRRPPRPTSTTSSPRPASRVRRI